MSAKSQAPRYNGPQRSVQQVESGGKPRFSSVASSLPQKFARQSLFERGFTSIKNNCEASQSNASRGLGTYSERGEASLSYFQRDFSDCGSRNIVFRAIKGIRMAKIARQVSYSTRGYPSSFKRGASFFQRERTVCQASTIRMPSADRAFFERETNWIKHLFSIGYRTF